ncbi:glycosyl hydrolase [Streptomyces sp. NPDC048484]|uniref:glycoside hydrolase 5 family protein n=1 Tax=Streptomyces sp. NPDC048484 TaxID=3155146 RepID=UPI0034489FC5
MSASPASVPSAPRFGVNYTPRRGWFHSWHDFDPAHAREDLAQIAGLGLDHVRVFHLWPLLQPNRTLIRTTAVDQLVRLVDLAAEAGLDVLVDGVQGHLSSFDFYPEWTRGWHHRNVFTDPEAVEAQAELLRVLGRALADRPNLIGLQLGNELNNLVEHNPVTAGEADHYLDTLLAAARDGLSDTAPHHLITHSAYDAAWYGDDHPFTPEASARKGDLTTVHPWVFSGDCARRYGPRSFEVLHLAEYGVELAKAYAEDVTRPVWVQETGAPEPHIPAADAPEFARSTVLNAAGCGGLWGVTWWCSHDVDRSLADYPELEYTLGLFDSAGRAKPIAAAFAEAVAEAVAEVRAAPRPGQPRDKALVLACTPATRSVSGPGGSFFEAWMRLTEQGVRPAVVLASRADDTAHLAARGITELVRGT